MRTAIQKVLLGVYRGAVESGLLATGPGKAVFEQAYWLYKTWLEAGDIELLRPYVKPGMWVIDVGANIGFFAVKFAQWVSEGARVIAIEPEDDNFRSLMRHLMRAHCADSVSAIRAAAAETSGTLKLAINRYNPADHWLSDDGVTVPAMTLDQIVADHGSPPVGFIKIDVQGAEARVLAGARAIIVRDRPALFVELDEAGLARAATSAGALIADLQRLGYRPHALDRGTVSTALEPHEAIDCMRARGYTDLLFLDATTTTHS